MKAKAILDREMALEEARATKALDKIIKQQKLVEGEQTKTL